MNINELIFKLDNNYSEDDFCYITSFLNALNTAGKSKNTIYSYFRDLKVFFDFKNNKAYASNAGHTVKIIMNC